MRRMLVLTVLLLACQSNAAPAPAPAPAPKPAASEGQEAPPERVHEAAPSADQAARERAVFAAYMPEHFAIVTWARDVVVNGQLSPLREPLWLLAEHDYPEVIAPLAAPLAELQRAALLTAKAKTIESAAAGIAAMARQCGDCHATLDRALVRGSEELDIPLQPDSFSDRMLRHGWALDRMWDGLVMASDSRWNAGANALADAPDHVKTKLPDAALAALEQIRTLGERARAVSKSEERAQIYGALLAHCGTCHREM
jgi:hypothetical protein